MAKGKLAKLLKSARAAGFKKQSRPAIAKAQKKKKNGASKKLAAKLQPKRGMEGISMVSDGVNVGSVWKNTTAERVRFPMAREKVMDLTSTGTTFQELVQLYVNPGNSELFPIFSQIAKNYEEYQPKHLKFYYRTQEYMASSSVVSAGLAALGTNFDPDAPAFATMTELENYEHSISGPPFSGIMVHDVLEERRKRGSSRGGSADLALKNYFVNYAPNQASPAATPAKFYDIGNFQLCVNGTQAGVIGELWVEYSFDLIRRIQQPGAVAGGVAHFQAITGSTGAQLTGMVLQPGNTLSGVTMTAQTISFPANQPGVYLVSLGLGGATSAAAITNSSVTGGASINPKLFTEGTVDQSASQLSVAGVTSAPAMGMFSVTMTNSAGTVVLGSPAVVGTGYGDVFIFALPSTVLTVDEREQIEIDNLVAKNDALERRLGRLESLLSGRTSPIYEEAKESDGELEKSVHIDRAALERLLLPTAPRLSRQ